MSTLMSLLRQRTRDQCQPHLRHAFSRCGASSSLLDGNLGPHLEQHHWVKRNFGKEQMTRVAVRAEKKVESSKGNDRHQAKGS